MDILPRRPLSLRFLTLSARIVSWAIALVVLVLSAAWLALQLIIVPRIGEFRAELERYASDALGVPVRMASIEAHADAWLPSFELKDLRLLDARGQPALQLSRVVVTLSPRSLWRLGFEQLAIDHPDLEVRRSADGRLQVAGIVVPQVQTDKGNAANWVFSQTEWVIRGGTVRWHDEKRAAPPLVLSQVELRMRNGARAHEFRLDATPPPELGGRLSLRGHLRHSLLGGKPGQWRKWKGETYAVFERVDVARLRRHVDLPLDVAGVGALRAWIDVDAGQVAGAVVDVALNDASWKPAADLPVLELRRLVGRLSGRATAQNTEIATRGLAFETVDGLFWRGGDLRVSLDTGAGVAQTRGEIGATDVDLGVLARLAQRLPLERHVREALQRYAPGGRLNHLQARWRGDWEAPHQFDARGRLQQIEVAAGELAPDAAARDVATPGVRGLNVDFDLNQDGGRAVVNMQHGHVELPGVFDQPRVALDQLAADVHWKLQGEGITLQVVNARFANADAQGEAQVSWTHEQLEHVSGKQPGRLDLQGSLARAEVVAVHRYLPRVIPAEVRDYLRHALVQGRGAGVRFRVKGDLRDFPFVQAGQGEFRITANVQDGQFNYVPASLQKPGDPAWPALTSFSTDLVIDRVSLELRNIAARLPQGGAVRIGGEANIPDFIHGARVQADLRLSGPLDGQLRGVLQGSALGALLGGVFDHAQAEGYAETQFRLRVPISNPKQTTVQGQTRLTGNSLQLGAAFPRLTRARGTVHFSESGFALGGVRARLLGGDVSADGGSIEVPGMVRPAGGRVRVQGSFTAAGLQQEPQLGAAARLAHQMSGGASYTAEFGLRQGVPELLFQTSLQGLALELPEPLRKSADAALPLRLQVLASDRTPGVTHDPLQDTVRLELGRLLTLRYERDLESRPARVLRGSLAVNLGEGMDATMPEDGVLASVAFDELDLQAWSKVLGPASQDSETTQGEEEEQAFWQPYLPTYLVVQGRRLVMGEHALNGLVAGASREGRYWRANVEARELSGYLEYRMAGSTDAGSLYARLARLVLAQEAARGVEAVLEEQPIHIPALDVVVGSLELRGKNLGRAQVEAVNLGQAQRDRGAREWRLNKLTLSMPEAELNASGSWAIYQELGETPWPRPAERTGPAAASPRGGERRRTALNFDLDVRDAGGLLDRLGMPGLVRSGKGRMEGRASWVGSPLSVNYPTLGGAFNLNIEGGQFLKAEPGLAKLLGVLSLQSLPRRLALDFRDVFSEGFSFDFVRGDVQVAQGVATTSNLQMKGVNAVVMMEGQADLARETQDLRVVVVPEINAGTASLIAGVMNPVIGLSTFLAQIFLRGPVIASATQEFRISGSWSEPQITKVQSPPPAAGKPDAEGP